MKSGSNCSFKIVSNEAKQIAIQVADQSGRLLYRSSQLVTIGSNIINIHTDKLSLTTGLVFITFRSEGFEKTFKQIFE